MTRVARDVVNFVTHTFLVKDILLLSPLIRETGLHQDMEKFRPGYGDL